MERLAVTPRPDWPRLVESQGFHFHTLDGEPYWDESACYRFTRNEIDTLQEATYALDSMCLRAVEHVLEGRRFEEFHIPEPFADWLIQSWETEEHTIYGRFDLRYDGISAPKLLEYNADTPTALLEAAVIQWFWLKDVYPGCDQFNSIHERLIEAWRVVGSQSPGRVHFAATGGHVEDFMTVNYLRDAAMQAGLETAYLHVRDIGWNAKQGTFVDLAGRPIETLFKLYPWEFLLRESFASHLPTAATRWLEAPWKMILSNKAILVVLHELFPDSPFLLPTAWSPPGDAYVRKPIHAREGANIAMVVDGETILETDGPYAGGPCICQELCPLPRFDDRYAVIGSWMVNGHACGLGIREDDGPITRNTSRFVPHWFQ